MMRVTAPARLHFGLLCPAGDAGRRFGGVGLALAEPALRLRAEPADAWSAEGPDADRALAFARLFQHNSPEKTLTPRRLIVEAAPPAHCGFGSGTQLGLAVARALAPDLDPVELARRVGRGARSALGVHAFAGGGFLVEAGKATDDALSPLVLRLAFPEAWRVVVSWPRGGRGRHGDAEQAAFRQLGSSAETDALCRLVLLGLVPALLEADIETFGEALFEYNARAGAAFAAAQGGTYAGPDVAARVAFLRSLAVRGVGQSSWGPAVFAIVEADKEEFVTRQLRDRGEEVVATRADPHGALVV